LIYLKLTAKKNRIVDAMAVLNERSEGRRMSPKDQALFDGLKALAEEMTREIEAVRREEMKAQ
jgi:hypothetical protein